jgi:hypothetical protein
MRWTAFGFSVEFATWGTVSVVVFFAVISRLLRRSASASSRPVVES